MRDAVELDSEVVVVNCGHSLPEGGTYVITHTKNMLLEDFNTLAVEKPEEYFKEMMNVEMWYLHITPQEVLVAA